MMFKLVCVSMLCAVAVAHSAETNASSIKVVASMVDKRTAFERATDILHRGTDTTEAISLLEIWLSAIPTDTSAAQLLATCYEKRGRIEEAGIARSIRPEYLRLSDPRVQTIYTPQVRIGSYRVLLPKNYAPPLKYPAVLLLHGNGQGPDVMVDWAKTLGMDSVIFICPLAPYVKLQETMQQQRKRYSASGDGIDIPDSMMAETVDESASWYHDVFIDASSKYSIARIKPIVVGFSQGGFYSYVVASRFPDTFQSVISVSASMYEYGKVNEYVKNLHTYGLDALILHGAQDNVVPLQTAELIYSMLKTAQVPAEFVKFDGGHWPSSDANQKMKEWMSKRLR